MLVSDEIRVQLWSMTPSALLQGATQADQKGADRFDHRKLLKWATNLTSAWKPTCSSIKWTNYHLLFVSVKCIDHPFLKQKIEPIIIQKIKDDSRKDRKMNRIWNFLVCYREANPARPEKSKASMRLITKAFM